MSAPGLVASRRLHSRRWPARAEPTHADDGPVDHDRPGPTQTLPVRSPRLLGRLRPSPAPTAAPVATPTVATPDAWIERPRRGCSRAGRARGPHLDRRCPRKIAYLFGGRAINGPEPTCERSISSRGQLDRLRPTGPAPAAPIRSHRNVGARFGTRRMERSGARLLHEHLGLGPDCRSWRELPSLGARARSPLRLIAPRSAPTGGCGSATASPQDDGRFADTHAYGLRHRRVGRHDAERRGSNKRCLHDCFWGAGRLILYGGPRQQVCQRWATSGLRPGGRDVGQRA
jgi:hypothetical protein